MGEERAAGILSLADDLGRRDADVAARLETASGLLRQVDELRARAGRIVAALEALPEQLAQASEAAENARSREAGAREGRAQAERRVEEVGRSRRSGEEARTTARRALERTTVAAADAAATVERTTRRLEEIAGDEIALRAEGEGLAVEARAVALLVADVPRLSGSGRSVPGTGLEEIVEWCARVHAALFVVRGGLENERERIVLEANGLAAAALGEHLEGANVALVRKRLEDALAGARTGEES